MNYGHADLIGRLNGFEFDSAFVHRLVQENGWTKSYALRVCGEYKRFALLSVIVGHPCTPSDSVDQVWHLHMIHTHAYWEHFCREVLRTSLHHVPTRGGPDERAKFRDWYSQTVASYRLVFGEIPPEGIWPDPKHRFLGSYRRVDLRRHLLLPKPGGWTKARPAAAVAAVAVLAPNKHVAALAITSVGVTGCAVIHGIPPLDMAGPSFLSFFIAAWLSSLAVIVILRRFKEGATTGALVPELDPYETAYLADGSEQATHAVIVALVHDNHLEVDRATQCLVQGKRAPVGGHLLERAVWRSCATGAEGGARPAELRRLVAAEEATLASRLEKARLVFPRAHARLMLRLALLVPMIGIVKVGVGLAFGEPVTLLLLLCISSTVFALSWLGPAVQRTKGGTALLAHLRSQSPLVPPDPYDASTDVAVTVGLFGLASLANTELAEVGVFLSGRSDSQSGGGGGACGGDGGCGGCGGCGGE